MQSKNRREFGPRVTDVVALLAIFVGLAGCGDASHEVSTSGDAAPTDGSGETVAIDAGVADADVGGIDVADARDAGDVDGADGSSDTSAPPSSVPTKPIKFTKDKPFTLDSGTTNYVYVPSAYDGTHETPMTLFVWLHGCGGFSSGDVWTVSPGGSSQTWITLAPGGAEGGCWDMGAGPGQVLAALADIKTHFNIKPKGVILGGYSSGGDLTYRTAFYNAESFAGVLVMNTSPFRDTGSKQAASLAAAAWKFNVVHVAHLQDTTYPIAGVRKETDAMTAAGFPMKRIEVDGGHWDDAGATYRYGLPETVREAMRLEKLA